MPQATARHILVASEQACKNLLAELELGADFATLASIHSTCPSKSKGGELGTFVPGQMVKEFNDVCFNKAVGVVHGPVKTQFGYHLLEVTARTD